MHDRVRQLAGGDRRSIGKANAVVQDLLADPSVLHEIVAGLLAADAVVRMRCADVAEKVSRVHPEWLQPYGKKLLGLAARTEQQELRWHLAEILPRLKLGTAERTKAVQLLFGWLDDRSRIVKVCAMEALACFAEKDRRLSARLMALLEASRRSGSPAVRARARKLIARVTGP